METPELNKNVRELQNKMGDYVSRDVFVTKETSYFSYIPYEAKVISIMYVIVWIILYITSPRFLYIEEVNKEPVFSYKKLFTYALLFVGILLLGFFGYKYKTEN